MIYFFLPVEDQRSNYDSYPENKSKFALTRRARFGKLVYSSGRLANLAGRNVCAPH